MAQTRKQKVLQQVKRQRQRRTITTMAVVIALVAIIGVGVWALSRNSGSSFKFPCLGSENVTLHVHPWLRIWIETSRGTPYNVTIPIAVGILNPQISNGFAGSGSCFEPLHTHDASGVIHIESGSRTDIYSLGDFCDVWFETPGDSTVYVPGLGSLPVNFNSTDILGFRPDQTHTLSLLIDEGQSTYKNSTDYRSLQLVPLDYCSKALGPVPPCSTAGAGGDPAYGGQQYPYGTDHTIVIYYRAI